MVGVVEVSIFAVSMAVLVITGIAVGFASGLLGVGGCFIMIPVQYWVYTSMGMDARLAILTAFGTNLAVVFPTAISGAYGHSKRGAVLWRAAAVMGITGAVGAFAGSAIAAHLPVQVLKTVFGLAILAGAVRMLVAGLPKVEEGPNENAAVLAACGIVLGIVTGIIGIGGGVLMVPVMVALLRFGMHRAVGTSTAVMIFTSLGGLAGYIVNGLKAGVFGSYPAGQLIGYFNLESWLALAVTSVLAAQIGVKTAHRLPAGYLKHIFIAVMVYMALKMIGLFTWLHMG
ncbi:sulfite exporter TauE/SafE family protein [Archaeoglobus neptunius]|uniref:sulfite exporter TauE/SafE family protein n=1 Tax=Archaeoglobus neptunius TaxID=2798580 RepID=UPI00192758A2|nr:sulfite exporter TauE/SafE family protein [Archaeoglobus neptunius]